MTGLLLPTINALVALQAPRGTEGRIFGVASAFQFSGFALFPFLAAHLNEWVGLSAAFTFGAAVLATLFIVAERLIANPKRDKSPI